MVGLDGLEPSTSRLSGVRSNRLSYKPPLKYDDFYLKCTTLAFALLIRTNGGDEEIRTPDPLLARQVLSQLSYTPMVVIRYRYLVSGNF